MDVKSFLRANWDRAVAATLVVLGGLALLLGWLGVSGTGLAAEQNPYLISGGVVGIALIAVGCTLWLSSDLQDEWRRLDAIEERLNELAPQQITTQAGAADGDDVVVERVATNGSRGVLRRAPRATAEPRS